ncbi:MAG: hypothetical protein ISS65_10795 [Desulfobacterales bacterium]|nr:hypothetical protein [Desulfobacterales bacterium]
MTNQKKPSRMQADVIAYCAKCKAEYCETELKNLDYNFQCPKDDQNGPHHLARVVKGPSGKFWLRIEKYLLAYEFSVTPKRWFKNWGGFFKGRAGRDLAIRFVILIVALNLASSLCDKVSIKLIFQNTIIIIIALFLMFDNLIVNTSIVFVSRFPANPLRSVLMTIFSFIQIIISYSIFYIIFPSVPMIVRHLPLEKLV